MWGLTGNVGDGMMKARLAHEGWFRKRRPLLHPHTSILHRVANFDLFLHGEEPSLALSWKLRAAGFTCLDALLCTCFHLLGENCVIPA